MTRPRDVNGGPAMTAGAGGGHVTQTGKRQRTAASVSAKKRRQTLIIPPLRKRSKKLLQAEPTGSVTQFPARCSLRCTDASRRACKHIRLLKPTASNSTQRAHPSTTYAF